MLILPHTAEDIPEQYAQRTILLAPLLKLTNLDTIEVNAVNTRVRVLISDIELRAIGCTIDNNLESMPLLLLGSTLRDRQALVRSCKNRLIRVVAQVCCSHIYSHAINGCRLDNASINHLNLQIARETRLQRKLSSCLRTTDTLRACGVRRSIDTASGISRANSDISGMLLRTEHTVHICKISAHNVAIRQTVRLRNCVTINLTPRIRLNKSCTGAIVSHLSKGILITGKFST